MNDSVVNNEEARYWNGEGGERWVENIDRLETMLESFSAHLQRAVNAQSGERILDIGCGGGPTSAYYANAVGTQGEVLGLDISAPILELARQRHAGPAQLEFLQADAATHAFERDHFDVVTSRYGVMFFPQREAAFRNIGSAARPAARLCLLVWRAIEDNPWMGAVARAAFSVLPRPESQGPDSPGPFSLGEQAVTTALLEQAGFDDLNFRAIDEPIVMGELEQALQWLCRMGPAARALAAAPDDQQTLAIEAMRNVLAQHLVDDRVTFTGGAWLISGRAAK